jgi:hypothetical protein
MIFLHVNQIILGFNMTCSSTVDKSWWHLKWWWSEWSRWSTTSPIANVIGNECLYSLYIVSLDPRVLLIGACQVFPTFHPYLGWLSILLLTWMFTSKQNHRNPGSVFSQALEKQPRFGWSFSTFFHFLGLLVTECHWDSDRLEVLHSAKEPYDLQVMVIEDSPCKMLGFHPFFFWGGI